METKPAVTYFKPRALFKKCIGKRRGEDGAIRPAIFWLGRDRAAAEEAASRIITDVVSQAGAIDTEGVWTTQGWDTAQAEIELVKLCYSDLAELLQNRRQGPALPTPAAIVTPSKTITSKSATLYTAVDAFVTAMKERGQSHKSVKDSIDALKQYQADMPLDKIGYAELEILTNTLKARPKSKKRSSKTGKREPISPYTVKRVLQYTRQALKWVHRQRQQDRFGGWRMPEDALELFSVNMTKIMTKKERDAAADGPDQFTIAELVDLYQIGVGDYVPHRMWFLTGLFAGLGQKELATIRRDEFDLATSTLTHRRNKTGQQGRYWLPPELVTMLKLHFEKNKDPESLAFRSRDGELLVSEKSDAARQAFDDWRERLKTAGKPLRTGLTFYSLRRFFADRAAKQGGDSLRDAALAHSAKTVGSRHYSNHRDFEAVAEVGRKLHAELTAAAMFQAVKSAD